LDFPGRRELRFACSGCINRDENLQEDFAMLWMSRSRDILPIATLAAFLLTVVPYAYGSDALGSAARTGDWTTVRSILDGGARNAAADMPDVDGSRPLHWAVRADQVEIAKLLLQSGADANAQNRLGVTPLYLAAVNGNPAMIAALVKAGADVNQVDKTGESILMTASRTGDAESVRVLLEAGANPSFAEAQLQLTPLMLAAHGGHHEIVRHLLKHGADLSARTRAGTAPAPRLPCVDRTGCGSHGVGIVRGGLPEHGSRAPIPGAMTPLMYASREGHVEVARLLLDAGADVNEVDRNDITPLMMAISNNRMSMAKFLVEKGASIHARDWYGRTPLFAAVEIRNVDLHYTTFEQMVTAEDRKEILEFIRLLLEKGADPNIRVQEVPPLRSWMYLLGGSLAWVDFTGQTPFLLASLSGDVDAMRLLLQYKADPHIPTFAGTTPLMAAAGVNWVVNQTYTEGEASLLEAVKLCVELGMDVNATNSMGLTALMGAANRGSDSIIEFLAAKGARFDVKDKVGRTAYNWAEGVFLATHAAVAKPSSMVLIERLSKAQTQAAR
jgi:ankyrin repeat protein